MTAGFVHLFELALKAENVARQAYQADAYCVAGSDSKAKAAIMRALAAADDITEVAKAIREAMEQNDEA